MALVQVACAILATWLLVAMAFMGIGLVARRLLGAESPEARDLAEAFWVGFAVVLLLLQVWHLFRPVDALAPVTVLALGFLGVVAFRRDIAASLRKAPHGRRRAELAAMAAAAAWLALRSMGPMTLHDSGMYHVPAVEWFKAFAIVPGLGNLHGRLAFNSASLLYDAMLDSGPWRGRAEHVANGLLLAVAAAQGIAGLAALWRAPARARPSDAVFALALPAVLASALFAEIPSYAADIPVFVLLIAGTAGALDLALRPAADRAREWWRLGVVAALLAAALCSKLSAGVYAVGVGIAALTCILMSHPRANRPGARLALPLVRQLLLPAALAMVFLVRGGILSGYPLYPSRILSLSLDWRAPSELADAEAAWIRMSGHNLDTNRIRVSGEWLGPWLRDLVTRGNLFLFAATPLAVAAGALLLLLWRRARGRPAFGAWRAGAGLLIPGTAAVAFWFITAPQPRFAQGALWGMAAVLGALAFDAVSDQMAPSRRGGWAVVVVAGLTLMFFARTVAGAVVRTPGGRVTAAVAAVLVERGPGGWLGARPEPDLTTHRTAGGVTLYVPRTDNLCWDAPLPCAPHPVPTLEYRRAGSLAAGFRITGPWEPLRWPNPWIGFLPWWRCVRAHPAPSRAERERRCLAAIPASPTPP